MRGMIAIVVAFAWCAEGALPVKTMPSGELIVVIGAKSADDLATLCNGGRNLVHALADAKVVGELNDGLAERGLYGMASAVAPLSLSPLPYADNLVNTIICEDAGVGELELLRVLAPGGAAFVRQGDGWKNVLKHRPPEMDDWTHFDYDAAGSGVSNDRLVKPPTNIQWRSEFQEYIGLGGNPAGYRPYTGFRVMNGRSFALYNTGKAGEKNAPVLLIARNAFNGVPLWKMPAFSSGNGTSQEYQFFTGDDRVFTYLKQDGPLTAIDAKSGAIVKEYETAAKLPVRGSKVSASYIMFRYAKGTIVQTAQNRLLAIDAKSGEVKWKHEEKEDYLCFPRVIDNEGKVLVQAVEGGLDKIQGRWANLKTSALYCFDLGTGKIVWKCDEIAGVPFGQSLWAGDKVYLFCPAGIGASDNWGRNTGHVAAVDAKSGKLLWKTKQEFKWGYNLLVRDGQAYFATPDTLNAVAAVDGMIAPFWKAPYNNRCNRTAATQEWIIMGLGIFVDKTGVANVKSISRSGCAQGAFPANGLTYFTPNTCTCFTMLRGHLALSAEAPREIVADEKRLTRVQQNVIPGKPTDLLLPIASEWSVQINNGAPETPPVRSEDGRAFVAVTHEHRLECRDAAGKVVWAFRAGGRISQPPVLHEGLVLFGAHDGYAYALRAEDGALAWRFLAAPFERYFVSHGQVESAYPVYNVVMFEGKACFTAGLHPEVGGGIWFWGVDPKSGAVAWKKRFARSEVIAKAGTKIAPNRVMNSPLAVEGQTLAITGLEFLPYEPDTDIQRRIDRASVGDKLRNLGWTIRGTKAEKR